MKKDHIGVPKPSSKFQKVNCDECGELQIVYSQKRDCEAIRNIDKNIL